MAEETHILAGHSHIGALIGARFSVDPMLQETLRPGLYSLDGPWPRTKAYWEKLVAMANDNRIAVIWGGNEHNSLYFFEAAYQFDFKSSHVTKIMNRFQIVAQSTIRRRFWESSLCELSALLGAVAANRPSKLVLVGTPPPKKDSDALRRALATEPHFLEWAATLGGDIDNVKITAPHIRLKLWYVLQDLFAEAAQKASASFVGVPAESQDEEGFLKPEYSANDVTHANEAYGALMLAKVMEELGQ